MARKKGSGKSSALSEEYVVDSDSNGLAEAGSNVQRTSSSGVGGLPANKKQKSDRTTSNRSAAQTESLTSDSHVNGEDDPKEVPSSSPEGSSHEKEFENGGTAEATQKLQKKKAQKKKMASIPISAPSVIPASPFRPPHGFQDLQPGALDSASEAVEAISGDLTDKQVWHVTAPASIPLNLIKDFNLDAARSGNPILVHKQRHYGLFTGSRDSQQLLLRGETGRSYKRSKASISKSYHLREIPNQSQSILSDKEQSSDAPAFFAKTTPWPKPPREQPKMLRMRYRPFGTNDSPSAPPSIGETRDPEERSSQPPSQNSPPLLESATKRKKKDKRAHRREQDGLVDDPMQIDEPPTQGSMAQEPPSQANMPGLKTPKDMNDAAEDKATPREKKRKKKRMHGEPSS